MAARVVGRSQLVPYVEVYDLVASHRTLSPGRGFYGRVGRSRRLLARGLCCWGLVQNGSAQLLKVRYELVPTLIVW